MGNNVTIRKGSQNMKFENILGHQIGNGAVQIINRDGSQTIVGNFDRVDIELSGEDKERFIADLEKAEQAAEFQQAEAEAKERAGQPAEVPVDLALVSEATAVDDEGNEVEVVEETVN